MFDELETVVLKRDLKEYGLKKGDIGTVVHTYSGKKAMEVEFVSASGKTIATITFKTGDVRPLEKNEIFHARGFASV